MTTFHCEYAWLGGETVERDVAIVIEGDRITSVTTGAPAEPGVTRLTGLTIPGLANGHSHAFHRALRSRTHGGEGSFWTWREQMYDLAARLDPDSYRRLAVAVYGEMLLAGYTSVAEFHYLHHGPDGVPYDDPNAMGAAIVDAAAEAGIRLTLLDTCYLHGGIGTDLAGVQRRFGDGDVLSWATRASDRAGMAGPTVRLGAAIHSVRAVEPAEMTIVAAWARPDAPLHAHVSEQPAENEQCRAVYGCSPVELLARHRVLDERFTAVHATHLEPSDIAALGAARSTVCLCPTTERDLADGVGPARALADAGVRLAIGSDSHAVIDPFEEIRAVELDQRLVTGRRGLHRPVDLLHAAAVDGHASIGWPEAGRIAAGALADLVTLGLDSVRLAGCGPDDLLAATVFAAAATDVRHVVVGGAVVVDHGRHARFDVAAALQASVSSP